MHNFMFSQSGFTACSQINIFISTLYTRICHLHDQPMEAIQQWRQRVDLHSNAVITRITDNISKDKL